MIIFNMLGLAFIGIGLAVAVAVQAVAGTESEGGFTLILGSVVMVTDLAFRMCYKDGHWFWPRRGGQLFFLPVWMFGALWTFLGGLDLYRGDSGR